MYVLNPTLKSLIDILKVKGNGKHHLILIIKTQNVGNVLKVNNKLLFTKSKHNINN